MNPGFSRSWGVVGCMLAALPALAGDALRPVNTTRQNVGALVDGTRGGTAVNDEGYAMPTSGGLYTTLFPLIPLADFTESGTGELIGFAHRRPPALVGNLAWSSGNDTIEVEFDDELRIDVHVWILDPTAGLAQDAADAGITVSQIWATERQGVAFEQFAIHDATQDPDAAMFLDFNCTLGGGVKTLIGYVDGAVNVYYATTVDFGQGGFTSNGVWCGGGIIGMGRLTGGGLLAHELGHALSLGHTNGSQFFDTTNVMHNASNVRQFLSEGQTFRAVYNPGSDLNDNYDVRDGLPTRFCGHTTVLTDPLCPALQKRVWADGAPWPPN